MAVEMIGGPRLCEPLVATGLGRFTGAAARGDARRHASAPWKRARNASAVVPSWRIEDLEAAL